MPEVGRLWIRGHPRVPEVVFSVDPVHGAQTLPYVVSKSCSLNLVRFRNTTAWLTKILRRSSCSSAKRWIVRVIKRSSVSRRMSSTTRISSWSRFNAALAPTHGKLASAKNARRSSAMRRASMAGGRKNSVSKSKLSVLQDSYVPVERMVSNEKSPGIAPGPLALLLLYAFRTGTRSLSLLGTGNRRRIVAAVAG